jgi:hydroxymethylbilane synthase
VTARVGEEQAIAAARAAVHHPPTAIAVAAERAFLRRVEGGCQVPVGALAGSVPHESGVLELRGRVVSLGGERAVEGVERGTAGDESSAELLGGRLADRLLAAGGADILAQVRTATGPAVSEP